jgi:hypothetical protein
MAGRRCVRRILVVEDSPFVLAGRNGRRLWLYDGSVPSASLVSSFLPRTAIYKGYPIQLGAASPSITPYEEISSNPPVVCEIGLEIRSTSSPSHRWPSSNHPAPWFVIDRSSMRSLRRPFLSAGIRCRSRWHRRSSAQSEVSLRSVSSCGSRGEQNILRNTYL